MPSALPEGEDAPRDGALPDSALAGLGTLAGLYVTVGAKMEDGITKQRNATAGAGERRTIRGRVLLDAVAAVASLGDGEPVVLVVDDEPTLRRSLSRLLQSRGCAVLTADDGEQAIAVLERENVDVALVDLMMPKVGGPELLEGEARGTRRTRGGGDHDRGGLGEARVVSPADRPGELGRELGREGRLVAPEAHGADPPAGGGDEDKAERRGDHGGGDLEARSPAPEAGRGHPEPGRPVLGEGPGRPELRPDRRLGGQGGLLGRLPGHHRGVDPDPRRRRLREAEGRSRRRD